MKGETKPVSENTLISGVFRANRRGFGFVTREDAEGPDIFIAPDSTMGAFDRDHVQVKVLPPKFGPDRPEGKVVRILSHEVKTVVGLYKKKKDFGFVIPDDSRITRDIFVKTEHANRAEHNQKVVVKLTSYGDLKHKPEGRVMEILGFSYEPGTDILSIVKQFELPVRFNFDTRKQLQDVPDHVLLEEYAGRRDLRSLFTVTIDGEDAKDLDDAITLSFEDGIYHLGVHIADVSHYVTEDSPLDRDAIERGTSVYLPDRVIPMLPEKLSNGICSLNAGVDRLAMSCLMDFDADGNILGHEITESVIRVDRRLSYTGVTRDLETGESDILEFLEQCIALSKKIRSKRYDRGAVDFDFPEAKIVLDERGKPVDIHPYERNDAMRMIEDFMLSANETIAEDAFWQELPFLYRIHEKPDPERMHRLQLLLKTFGYSLHMSNGTIHPMELAKLLQKIEGTEEEPLLSRMILRSMKKAAYSEQNAMHFGLAAQYYTHFTSPIRRYPDLLIHRILKENLKGKLDYERRMHYDALLPGAALRTSTTERRADECEREAERMKKAQYMRHFIGEVFPGVISGITPKGFYVELENTCEGLVSLDTMDGDRYHFIEEEYLLRGDMTGRVFRPGQRVSVVVSNADESERTVDFRLYEEE